MADQRRVVDEFEDIEQLLHVHEVDRPCSACAAGEAPEIGLCWNCGQWCEGCSGDRGGYA